MEDRIKANIAKVLMWGALAWATWKVTKGIAEKKSSSEIVKETVAPITNVAAEVKKVTKKFLKGSPEAKEYMRSLREKGKNVKRGEGKRAKKKAAGKLGGEATADLGEHKGHETSEGLKQDQSKVSKELHEKHYQKSKKKKT